MSPEAVGTVAWLLPREKGKRGEESSGPAGVASRASVAVSSLAPSGLRITVRRPRLRGGLATRSHCLEAHHLQRSPNGTHDYRRRVVRGIFCEDRRSVSANAFAGSDASNSGGSEVSPPERGAWYADPFGSGLHQRWWDGSKWTNHVRDTPPDDAPAAVRSAAPSGLAERTAVFELALDDFLGEGLRLQLAGDRAANFEVVSALQKRIATLSWGRTGELMRMKCSAGEWWLWKRRRLGWELIIQSPLGELVGWYSGRRWRAGGTIFLKAGPELDLVKSLVGRWTLRTVDSAQPIMHLHGSSVMRSLPRRIELVSAPSSLADLPVAVLTAFAIAVLDEWSRPARR